MGSAADVRFSLSTATHAPSGLHRRYSALREESAKVRGGGVSVEGSPQGAWGQFSRVPGSSFTDGWRAVQILPLPSPPCGQQLQPGLGPLSAATAVPPHFGLLVGKR